MLVLAQMMHHIKLNLPNLSSQCAVLLVLSNGPLHLIITGLLCPSKTITGLLFIPYVGKSFLFLNKYVGKSLGSWLSKERVYNGFPEHQNRFQSQNAFDILENSISVKIICTTTFVKFLVLTMLFNLSFIGAIDRTLILVMQMYKHYDP